MKWLNKIEDMKNTYVAYGSFDGMHKGHLAVIKELSARAKQDGAKSIVISRCKKEQTEVLSTEEEKAYYIEKEGVEYFFSYEEQDTKTEEEFLKEIIVNRLGAKLIVTGANDPSLELIEKISKENMCDVCAVDTVSYKGVVLTNKLLKQYFTECKFQELTEMCGHTYVMIGEVVHGKALGRTVGMPTANLGVAEYKLKPPSGVYATRTFMEEESYQGLTNIGTRPSVDDMPIITIETFLLDFSKDIYGKKLIMEVHLYIRGVQKFDSLEEVQNQVQKDISQVKDYLDTLS